jgi:hypothetical protein
MPQNPCTAVETIREAEPAENTSGVDVNKHRLIKWAGGDSLTDVHLPDVPVLMSLSFIFVSPISLTLRHGRINQ